jgi:glycosyltransferase involved in cell wall biosynthesis
MKSDKPILVRITTVPISLEKLLHGQLRFMSSFYRVIGISSTDDGLEKVRAQEGIEVWKVPMTRKITPVQDLKTVVSLYRYFRKIKPSIVHSHTPKAGIVAMLAAKLAGVPHRLHTVAGLPLLEATGAKRKLLDAVEKLTYACATHVYPNSKGLSDIILQNGYAPARKVKVLANGSSNGIDTSYFSTAHFSADDNTKLKESLGIMPDDFTFIFVGRLVGDKGMNELMAAYEKLKADYPQAKLLLVGDFESDLDPLKPETVDRINNTTGVITTGFRQDVRPYLAISDTLVLPTYREGFPNVVLQAGAMGLPSIVTDINGCNEIVSHEINGLIIPVKDEMAIFKAMKRLLDDTALHASMRGIARDQIVSRFEQRVVWEAILQEYQTLR